MSRTWEGDPPPKADPLGLIGALRVGVKGLILAVTVFGGLGLLLLIRLVERPLFGLHRPVTPRITVAVCRAALAIIGLPMKVRGKAANGHGAIVANHSTWLDIFVLNATGPLYFVAKSEVAGWPGIGWLARATGTLFIRRQRNDAARQRALFAERVEAGHRLLFFPEGTSTDSLRVLPFKPTLFAAFFDNGVPDDFTVTPVSVVYHAPTGEDARFYGWWGDMDFAPNLAKMLAAPRHGRVDVIFHEALLVRDAESRKALAGAAEAAVRSGFDA